MSSIYVISFFLIDISRVLREAITDRQLGHVINPFVLHQRIRSMYTWQNVATKTETVRAESKGLHMNGVRSHAHAPAHAINLIRRAIIARHGFKYFTYGVRGAHALNTNHRHIARLEYKSKT